jgi:spore coat protein U-like protein
MKRLILPSMMCLGLSVATLPAIAATANGDMAVQSEVTAVCTIEATPMTFAGYSQTTPTDTTSTATVQCTGTSGTLNFTVGDGNNFTTSRQLTDGTNFLNYNISQTLGGATLVNTDQVATAVSAATGTGTVTLHGRIPSGQGNKPAGTYIDTVRLTLTY